MRKTEKNLSKELKSTPAENAEKSSPKKSTTPSKPAPPADTAKSTPSKPSVEFKAEKKKPTKAKVEFTKGFNKVEPESTTLEKQLTILTIAIQAQNQAINKFLKESTDQRDALNAIIKAQVTDQENQTKGGINPAGLAGAIEAIKALKELRGPEVAAVPPNPWDNMMKDLFMNTFKEFGKALVAQQQFSAAQRRYYDRRSRVADKVMDEIDKGDMDVEVE